MRRTRSRLTHVFLSWSVCEIVWMPACMYACMYACIDGCLYIRVQMEWTWQTSQSSYIRLTATYMCLFDFIHSIHASLVVVNTREWVTTHVNASCHMWTSDVTWEWVISHSNESHCMHLSWLLTPGKRERLLHMCDVTRLSHMCDSLQKRTLVEKNRK